MNDLNRVVDALRNADAAGDEAAARRLAAIAKDMRDQQAPSALSRASKQIGAGMVAPIAAGVDAIHGVTKHIPGFYKGDEPFMGSKWAESHLGVGGEPETTLDYAARGVGEVSGLLLPMGVTTKLLTRGTGLVAKIAQSVYAAMVKYPALTMGSEVTAGAGAGMGRKVGEESDNPLVRAGAELAGGLVGGAVPTAAVHAPTAMAWRTGQRILRKISLPFSEAGSKYRAGEFVKSKVPSPEDTIARLGAETIGDLPPVVQAAETRLTNIHKSIIAADPIKDQAMIERLSRSAIQLEGEMRKLGYGSSEFLADITRRRIANIEMRMDRRVLVATQRAHNQLESLPVAGRQSQESIIVRKEIERVMRHEKGEVDKLWGDVPKSTAVGTSNTRAKFAELEGELAFAQRTDIPAVLSRDPIISNKELTTTTIKEMQGLRSKLLENARIARKNGHWNRARISDEMADAILEDMAATEGGEALQTAIQATRKFKETFTQGVVGKVLGYDKTGAPKIDMEVVLNAVVGRRGAQAAVNVDRIPMTPEIENAMKRYITRSFSDYSLDSGGAINPAKANRWMRNNEDVLDRFPDLHKQLSDASEAQKIATQTREVMDARKRALQDPRISVAARFIETTDLGTEINAIFKAKHPARMTRELVRQASKDPSGQAIEGLRASMADYVLEMSSRGGYNELGERVISGNDMMGFINKSEGVLRQVFTPEQMGRMKRIASEFSKLQQYMSVSGHGADTEMKDFASNALRMASRVVGARVGGKIGAGTSGGSIQAAGIMSGRAKAFMTWLTKNRAEALLHDAILSPDPQLLQALLLPLDKPQTQATNLRILNDRLNVWLLGAGSRVMDDIIKAEEE